MNSLLGLVAADSIKLRWPWLGKASPHYLGLKKDVSTVKIKEAASGKRLPVNVVNHREVKVHCGTV